MPSALVVTKGWIGDLGRNATTGMGDADLDATVVVAASRTVTAVAVALSPALFVLALLSDYSY